MAITDELLADAKDRMAKSVESSRGELATVRTGRASPHLLDRIVVDYYGSHTPLKQLANIAASDTRLLTVTPFDKGSIGEIEKAIQDSDVGLTPNNDGNVIRLQIPEMTEERRREMVKVVHGVAEEGRVAIRNVRRDVMSDLRELKSEGEVGEDDERRAETTLQKQTDEAIERGLTVMDSTALSLCMDNDLPIYVFNMGDERNIDRIVSGERVGTLVSSAPAAQ